MVYEYAREVRSDTWTFEALKGVENASDPALDVKVSKNGPPCLPRLRPFSSDTARSFHA